MYTTFELETRKCTLLQATNKYRWVRTLANYWTISVSELTCKRLTSIGECTNLQTTDNYRWVHTLPNKWQISVSAHTPLEDRLWPFNNYDLSGTWAGNDKRPLTCLVCVKKTILPIKAEITFFFKEVGGGQLIKVSQVQRNR